MIKLYRKRPVLMISLTIVAALVLIGACGFMFLAGPAGSGDYYAAAPQESFRSASAPTAMPTMAAVESDGIAQGSGGADGAYASAEEAPLASPPQQERIILRDASLTITVEDTDATIDSIEAMADEMGGWVVTANSSTSVRGDEIRITNGNITVRVPAERLDEALATIREGVLEVNNESITGRDVTEEYVDLSSRLDNLEATEDQLVEILATAYSVEDVLAVQRELTTVRGQIEVIEGRLRYFDEAAAFSSIAVNVRERVPSVGNVEVAGWNPLATAENAFGALVVAGQFLADSAITLAILGVPGLIVLWLVVMAVRRAWRFVQRGRTAPTPAAE